MKKILFAASLCGILLGGFAAETLQINPLYSVKYTDSEIQLLDKEKKTTLTLGRILAGNNEYLVPVKIQKTAPATLKITYRKGKNTKLAEVPEGTVQLRENGIRFTCKLNPGKSPVPGNLFLETKMADGMVYERPGTTTYQSLYNDGGSVSLVSSSRIRNYFSPGKQRFMIPLSGSDGKNGLEYLAVEPDAQGVPTLKLDILTEYPYPEEMDPLFYATAYSLHVNDKMQGDDGFFPVGVLGEALDSGFQPFIGANYMIQGYSPSAVNQFSKKGVSGLSIWAAIHCERNPNVKHTYTEDGKQQKTVCLFDKASREIIYDYARDVVKKMLKTEDGKIFKWEIDNEYIPALDYSPEARIQFREWLKKSYAGNLEKMNRAWRTSYKSFEEAEAPGLNDFASKPAAFMDWSRFQQEGFASFLGEYYAAIYNADPKRRSVNGKDTQSSLEMQRIARTKRSNHELIGKAVAPYTKGVRGMDHYGHGDRNTYEINYYYNTIVPAGHEPGTRAGMLYGENNNHNGPGWQFAQTSWRILPNGFRGGSFFCNGWFGCWGDWASFGFTNPDGTRRDKFYYLPRFYSMIHRSEKLLTQSAIPRDTRKVAILFAQRDVPFGVDDNISPWGFPINSRWRLYSRLRDAGYWVQAITYDKLKPEYMKDIAALFLISAEHFSNEELTDVRNYVKNGGVLFADTRAGFFDEHHLPHETGLSDVLGVKFQGMYVSHDVVVDPGDVWFPGRYGNLVRADGRVNFELTTAKPVDPQHAFFVSNKAGIMTRNKFGKGQAFWINTQFGTIRSESAVGEAPVVEWYRDLLSNAGVAPSYTMKPEAGEHFRLEIPLIDTKNNTFMIAAGTTYQPTIPMEVTFDPPKKSVFRHAFYGLAEDYEIHKLPFRKNKNGSVTLSLPAIKSAASLYFLNDHAPLVGMRIENAKRFVAADPHTAEFQPGESFDMTLQLANPNASKLDAGTLRLRALQGWTVSAPQTTKPLPGGEIAEYKFRVQIPKESAFFRPNFIYPLAADFTLNGKRIALNHMIVSLKLDMSDKEVLLSDNWNSGNYPWAIWTGADYRTLTVPDLAKKESIEDTLHTVLGHGKKVYSLQSGDRADRLRSAKYTVPEAEVEFDLKANYDLTRTIIRRGNRANETPEFIEFCTSNDGKKFTAPQRIRPQWQADFTTLPVTGKARYVRIKFVQYPNKSSRIDDVWILGKK